MVLYKIDGICGYLNLKQLLFINTNLYIVSFLTKKNRGGVNKKINKYKQKRSNAYFVYTYQTVPWAPSPRAVSCSYRAGTSNSMSWKLYLQNFTLKDILLIMCAPPPTQTHTHSCTFKLSTDYFFRFQFVYVYVWLVWQCACTTKME